MIEVFAEVTSAMFHPDSELFSRIASNGAYDVFKLQNDGDSSRLFEFEACGRFLALALLFKQPLGVTLPDVLCEELLQKRNAADTQIALERLGELDPTFASSLSYLLNLSASALADLDLAYQHPTYGFDLDKSISKVTKQNVRKYVIAVASYRHAAMEIQAMVKGFKSIIPSSTSQYFSAKDLKHVLAGEKEFNVDSWRRITIVSGDTTFLQVNHLVDWFWKVMFSDSVKYHPIMI